MWERLVVNRTSKIRKLAYQTNADLMTMELIGEHFEMTPTLVKFLDKHGTRFAKGINRSTAKKLGRQLSIGTGKGESYQEMAQRLDSVFKDRRRSRTVARTEMGMASQAGQLEGMSASGVVKWKQWNTSRDAAVRDSHLIDGASVPLQDEFILGSGNHAMHPLDRNLPAEDVVNCRCFVTAIVED
jgi:uncharacterized protein with gpF-like domain